MNSTNTKTTLVSIGLFLKNINKNGADFWMQTRFEKGSLNGLWEFPGGKIESGESASEALIREIREEVGCTISEKDHLLPLSITPYQFEDRKVCLHSFLILNAEKLIFSEQGKWFPLLFTTKSSELRGIIPTINHKIIDESLLYLQILHEQQNQHILKKYITTLVY